MKFFLVHSLFLILGSSIVFSATLKDIDANIRADQTHQPSKHYRDSKSGYDTNVHIVGRRKVFIQKRFSPQDFDRWITVFIKAKTLEEIDINAQKGKIGPYGVVISVTPVKIGAKTYRYHDVIKFNDALNAQHRLYFSEQFFKRLITQKVLDKHGYLVNTKQFIDKDIQTIDFSFIREKLVNVVWPLENKSLHLDLVEDLRRLLIIDSQILIITQGPTIFSTKRNTAGMFPAT